MIACRIRLSRRPWSTSPHGLEGDAADFHISLVLFVEVGSKTKVRRRGESGPVMSRFAQAGGKPMALRRKFEVRPQYAL